MSGSAGTTTAASPPSFWTDLRRPVLLIAGFLLLAGLVSGPHTWNPPVKILVAHLLVIGFGAAVGAGELVSRYRDDPATALRTEPAWLYMAVNAAVAWAAFWLIWSGRIALPTEAIKGHPLLNALIIGGFSGMALFRASFINLRVRDREVALGPAEVLQIILRATDRAVDRERASRRAAQVRSIMRGVTFHRARYTLPAYCYGLMQNLTREERDELDQWVVKMEKDTSTDGVKAFNLGLQLMNLVGAEVLQSAVDGLGDTIKGPPPDEPVVLGWAPRLGAADLRPLYEVCVALAPKPSDDRAWPTAAELLTFADIADDATKVVIGLARLRRAFGPETVAQAIGSYISREAGKEEEVEAEESDFGPPSGAATTSG